MKTIVMLYRVTCKHCREALGIMETLQSEKEMYRKLPIRYVDVERDIQEGRRGEVLHVPCYYVGEEKAMEGIPDKKKIEYVFQRAFEKNELRDYLCGKMLREEIVPALGCTEPGMIAYAAALAREVLGDMPEYLKIWVSGNILKNVKSVCIPNCENVKGVAAAAYCGILGGKAKKQLEVLNSLTAKETEKAAELVKKKNYNVSLVDTEEPVYVKIWLKRGSETSEVEIKQSHTFISKVMKNGENITGKYRCENFERKVEREENFLKLTDYYEFSKSTDISLWKELLDRQMQDNMEISREGLNHVYGAAVGRNLLHMFPAGEGLELAAYAAAGSDARMGGSSLPVVTNAGSGNQGITISVPVVLYGKNRNKSREQIYRALIFANLVSVYIKSGIGRLSAFCGAVNAGCASACGIAFLEEEPLAVIEDIVTNTLGTISGIICDGAKPSCAAKIAVAVQMGMLAYEMAKEKCRFSCGEGIVGENADETIRNISVIGKEGMRHTDKKILDIMLAKQTKEVS